MKRPFRFSFLVAFFFANLTASAQSARIDRLIDSIDNNQVGIVPQYVWYPAMKSPWGDSLINIGNLATKPLIQVLDDSTKGIIAHFILSKIYWIELMRTGHTLGSNVSPVENEQNAFLRILYNGLIFYSDNRDRLFTKQAALDGNKQFWQKFIDELYYR